MFLGQNHVYSAYSAAPPSINLLQASGIRDERGGNIIYPLPAVNTAWLVEGSLTIGHSATHQEKVKQLTVLTT